LTYLELASNSRSRVMITHRNKQVYLLHFICLPLKFIRSKIIELEFITTRLGN